MATQSQKAKSNKTPKYSTRIVRRCWRCRICFRELANNGKLPGIRKSSW